MNRNQAWPVGDLWLLKFLEGPKNLLPCDKTPLLDHHWWELLGTACNGIDEPFLTKHFSAMALWIYDNPERKPKTARGWRKFVSHWLRVEAEKRYLVRGSFQAQDYRRLCKDR